MTMPGGPRSMFVLIHPQFAFALLKTLLDRPAQERGFAYFGKRHIGRRIGEGKFGLPIRIASDKEPYRRVLRKPISGGVHPQAFYLGHDRALGPFSQNDALPQGYLAEPARADTGFGWA